MRPEIILILILTLFPILIISVLIFESRRSEEIIQKWAKINRYKLIEKKQSIGDVGPFNWSANQRVYRIKVQDENGSIRDGYACCGGFFTGILSGKIDVKLI